ncbi:MAG: hypothetical protein IPK26_29170 [Planctomycetes bacterium]|nr:hypothetical protein [Planctomycetota bacterium]
MQKFFPLAVCASLASLTAQSNTVPGLNGRLTSISNISVVGVTATEVSCAAQNDMCNPGSVVIPWHAAGSSGQMGENHPKFGFMVAREFQGRFEQISDRSFCKHAFVSVNGSGVCGNCIDPGTGSVMGINCTDAYGVGNNSDPFWLGPAPEIDPWLGTWNRVGSYFDRGLPEVGTPNNTDGRRSPINATATQVSMRILKTDLNLGGATYWYQIHLVHEGEAVANRGDNLMTRRVTFSGSGNNWSSADSGTPTHGSILSRWTGATVTSGGNGNDDGRFYIGVKTTNLNGTYRYEYAVHNVDNRRGAATFRVPVCANATVTNITFRDIDQNALNQWTSSRVGNELVFTAPANNSLDWNTIYNFGFESSAAPGAGTLLLDQARTGAGGLTVVVNGTTPGTGPSSSGSVNILGPGCSGLLLSTGLPTSPNPTFGLQVLTAPNSGVFAVWSFGTANIDRGNGCTQWLDPQTLGVHGLLMTNGVGVATLPLPIPVFASGFTINWQMVPMIPNGPILGQFAVTNALQLVTTITGGGCQ